MSYPFVRDIHYFTSQYEAKYPPETKDDSTDFGHYTIKCFSTTEEPNLEPRRLLVFCNGTLLDPHKDYEVGPRTSKYGSLGSKEVRLKRVIRGSGDYPSQEERVDLIYYPMVEEEMEYAFEVIEVDGPPAKKDSAALCHIKRLSDEDYVYYNYPYAEDERDDLDASWYGPEKIKNEKLMIKAKWPTEKRKYTGKHNTNKPHFMHEELHNEDRNHVTIYPLK